MLFKIIILTLLHHSIFGLKYTCNQRSALLLLKRPAYEFSTRILDRVAQNNDVHFTYSPLSTWLQLMSLAEGATGKTFHEIWRVTRHHRNPCFKLKLAKIFNKLNRRLQNESLKRSVMVIDELMAVKKKYIRDIQMFYKVKVLLKSFDYPQTSAAQVNKWIKIGTLGAIKESVDEEDFNSTVLLTSDNLVFKSAWKHPFNPAYTMIENFYSDDNLDIPLGDVNMMEQTGYFNMTEFPLIKCKILEIPSSNDVSMLIFLPFKGGWIEDLFLDLQRTKLTSIYNMFKSQGEKLVNVKLPRFKIQSTVQNLPELLYDMGVRRLFDAERAELDKISDYRLYASVMLQTSNLEVTEQGVRGTVAAESLVNDTRDEMLQFHANRPFGFIIADRQTQFIIFAGIYSKPSVF